MSTPTGARVVCFSNVYDPAYCRSRGGEVEENLIWVKSWALFQCLEKAAEREVIVLSAPPRALVRLGSAWVPAFETRFGKFRQFFCTAWDLPKIRLPFVWISYAWNALRKTRAGDVIVINNFELIYILAARLVSLVRPVTFLLDYEDGKHLIDQSWPRMISSAAEWLGRGLIRGAVLAHPALQERLPAGIPTEVVPGFMPETPTVSTAPPVPPIRFLYSGSMDSTRGLDLLLEALPLLPEAGWRLEISGTGLLREHVAAVAAEPRWLNKITYHGVLPRSEYETLMATCHVGMNCQRSTDVISSVTFPSKVFTYLSAGLKVLSSEASWVRQICGEACSYYQEETPAALAAAMQEVLANHWTEAQREAVEALRSRHTIEGTTQRIHRLLASLGLV
jgi:glycosyltransferase involved in cell wall biosynthesis